MNTHWLHKLLVPALVWIASVSTGEVAQAQPVVYYGSPYPVYYYPNYYPNWYRGWGYQPSYWSYSVPETYVWPTAPAPVTAYRSYYPPAAAPGQEAVLTVKVPPDAEVWLQGVRMTQTGGERQFTIPPLAPGQPYVYDVRARWRENGEDVDWTRRVRVQAGGRHLVDFLARPSNGSTFPAPTSAPPR